MEDHPHGVHHNKTLFEMLPPKSAFWLGFGTAILTLGTLGFILLGTAMLNGNFAIGAGSGSNGAAGNGAAVVAQPTEEYGSVPVVTDDDYIRGDKNAEITIIEYSDFECPFCGRFHPTMEQVMDNYKGKVKWVLRSFPLSFHPEAEPAALAAECAGEQGKFWEFADDLFANQDSLSTSFYSGLATKFGLNISKFNDCVSSGKYLDKIRAQAQSGGAAGVTGTPGSFIIGADGTAIPIKGALPYESVASAIDELLN